jgi:hypothetical protein
MQHLTTRQSSMRLRRPPQEDLTPQQRGIARATRYSAASCKAMSVVGLYLLASCTADGTKDGKHAPRR